MLDGPTICRILAEYGFDTQSSVDPEFISKLLIYIGLLIKWNKKISLTSITNEEDIVRKHFGESLYCLNFVEISYGRLADVGSGAGFPALPIKLARPSLGISLYEPNLKKATFLNEVIRSVGLSATKVIRDRVPEIQPEPGTLRYVTTRAVSMQDKILGWALAALDNGGNAVFWVGKAESDNLRSAIEWEWKRPALIPGTGGSYIVHGRKL
jgi:16S rRNA (guanine527-N7)-methyltransferase